MLVIAELSHLWQHQEATGRPAGTLDGFLLPSEGHNLSAFHRVGWETPTSVSWKATAGSSMALTESQRTAAQLRSPSSLGAPVGPGAGPLPDRAQCCSNAEGLQGVRLAAAPGGNPAQQSCR